MNKMGFYLLNTVTLLMLVVFSFSMISASASESGENTVSKIKEIISEVYWQKDMNSQSNGLTEDTMDMLSTDIANFLIKKIDTQQYVTQLYGTDKENYSISVKLKSSNIFAEKK